MAHNEMNKEMVDLVIRIKKHLRDKYDMSIALADPELLDKLVKLKNMDDAVLQGMLSYLTALAGPEWTARFNDENATLSPAEPGAEKKRMFGLYRGKSASTKGKAKSGKTDQERRAETLYRGKHRGKAEKPADEPPTRERRPVRYYRGQPIYDD